MKHRSQVVESELATWTSTKVASNRQRDGSSCGVFSLMVKKYIFAYLLTDYKLILKLNVIRIWHHIHFRDAILLVYYLIYLYPHTDCRI